MAEVVVKYKELCSADGVEPADYILRGVYTHYVNGTDKYEFMKQPEVNEEEKADDPEPEKSGIGVNIRGKVEVEASVLEKFLPLHRIQRLSFSHVTLDTEAWKVVHNWLGSPEASSLRFINFDFLQPNSVLHSELLDLLLLKIPHISLRGVGINSDDVDVISRRLILKNSAVSVNISFNNCSNGLFRLRHFPSLSHLSISDNSLTSFKTIRDSFIPLEFASLSETEDYFNELREFLLGEEGSNAMKEKIALVAAGGGGKKGPSVSWTEEEEVMKNIESSVENKEDGSVIIHGNNTLEFLDVRRNKFDISEVVESISDMKKNSEKLSRVEVSDDIREKIVEILTSSNSE